MIKLLSPPGILTGLVVTLSVAGGVAFGVGAVSVLLAINSVYRRARI